jgi:hypothetical protein
MSLEHKQLKEKANDLRQRLQAKRKESDEIEKQWVAANRNYRDWSPGASCNARSLVDGWLCCLNNDHEHEHETAGGYKFYQTR